MKIRFANTELNDIQETPLTDYSHKRINEEDAKEIYAELMDCVTVDRILVEKDLCTIIADELFGSVWGEGFIQNRPDSDVSKVTRLASAIIKHFTGP